MILNKSLPKMRAYDIKIVDFIFGAFENIQASLEFRHVVQLKFTLSNISELDTTSYLYLHILTTKC